MTFDDVERRIRATAGCSSGTPATANEIAAAESALDLQFHPSLREYLRRFGWLELSDREYFGLGKGVPPFLDLVRVTTSERTEAGAPLPRELMPLLNDGGGNLYCVVCEPGTTGDGRVVLWDHELGEGQEPVAYADGLELWLDSQLDEVEGG